MCRRPIVKSLVLAVNVALIASGFGLAACAETQQANRAAINERVSEAGFVLCVQTLGLVPRVAKVATTIGVETVKFAQTLCRIPNALERVLAGHGDELLPVLATEAACVVDEASRGK